MQVLLIEDNERMLAALEQGLREDGIGVVSATDGAGALARAARGDLDLLSRLPVPGARGPVPLSNVATLAIDSGPAGPLVEALASAAVPARTPRREILYLLVMGCSPMSWVRLQKLWIKWRRLGRYRGSSRRRRACRLRARAGLGGSASAR